MIIAHFHSQSSLFLFVSSAHTKNLIYFVFFIEIYQIWPENFEEIIIIYPHYPN